MKRNLLIVIIAVVVIVFTIFSPIIIGVLAIPVWIYLVWMVRKKNTGIFYDQMEPALAEKRLKRLKTFLTVAGLLCIVSIAGIIMHNVESALSEMEDSVFFIIGIAALWVFIILTAVGLVIFLTGRQKTT